MKWRGLRDSFAPWSVVPEQIVEILVQTVTNTDDTPNGDVELHLTMK